MYEQGDIVLIPFPYSDLSSIKLRPALILSNSKLDKLPDRICCFITSKSLPDGIKITLKDYQQGRLPFQSWVKPYRIFTIHEKIIRKKLCRMTPEFHERILESLKRYIE